MNNDIQQNDTLIDSYVIQQAIIKLTMAKYDGKEPTKQEIIRFSKYLIMEYENNTSKNSLEKRITSICKTIESKYQKYLRISKL